MANHLETQNPVDVAIDEAGRRAQGSVQWFLEDKDGLKAPPVTHGNHLRFMICGEEGFASIAKDLSEARETVDIICWGFDPGMELERSRDKWPRGHTYGSLLEQLAGRGIKVRLLIWFNTVASRVQNNMPGFTDHPLPGSPYADPARQKYCVEWWARNLPHGTRVGGQNPNLQVLLRDVATADVLLAEKNEDPSGSAETFLMENFGTHHQKPVLIDYAHDAGSKAVGYVMGLNSVTDFWDRTAHDIDDPLRETWAKGSVAGEIKHETVTQGQTSTAWYRQTKPYQDYACRIVGPALAALHSNFVSGWNDAGPPASWKAQLQGLPPALKPSADPGNPVQIVRTQAHDHEKTIKQLYFQATSYARNYIYIENQYFFYPEFARHLKEERMNFCRAWKNVSGKPIDEIPKLHLFIVVPHPEQDGMVPRTFDTLTELGASDTMPEQEKLVDDGKRDQRYPNSHKGKKGNLVVDRPTLQQLERTMGLEVSVARLRTSGLDANHQMAYREIYIHSKLMLIDDVFVTVGSANLNMRSMAVDSEINMAATGLAKVSELRQRVFELHSGGKVSGTGDRGKTPEVFDKWVKRMDNNRLKMKDRKAMQGFLLPFEDHRDTTMMVASVTIPATATV